MPSSSPHWEQSPPELIDRFGMTLERFPELEQRKMLGYPAAFVAAGHVATGLHRSSWVVRLGGEDQLKLRAAGGIDFEPMPARPMEGFLSLPTDIVADNEALAGWVSRVATHVATLPPKTSKKPSATKR